MAQNPALNLMKKLSNKDESFFIKNEDENVIKSSDINSKKIMDTIKINLKTEDFTNKKNSPEKKKLFNKNLLIKKNTNDNITPSKSLSIGESLNRKLNSNLPVRQIYYEQNCTDDTNTNYVESIKISNPIISRKVFKIDEDLTHINLENNYEQLLENITLLEEKIADIKLLISTKNDEDIFINKCNDTSAAIINLLQNWENNS